MTPKNTAYRVIAFTGRVVEELAERPTEGEAREILRASAFPAALVFPGDDIETNKRGRAHEVVFERFVAQSTSPQVSARARRVQAVPVESMPKRAAAAVVEEPEVLGPESFGGDEYRADEPAVEEAVARACEAERHASFAESQAELSALRGPATAAERDAQELEAAASIAKTCARDDCDDPRQAFTDRCHPALQVFCKRHRTHAMIMRSKRGITAEEAAALCIALGAAPRAEERPAAHAERAAQPEHGDLEEVPAVVEPRASVIGEEASIWDDMQAVSHEEATACCAAEEPAAAPAQPERSNIDEVPVVRVEEPLLGLGVGPRPWRSVVELVDDLGGVEALAQLAPVVRRAGGAGPVIALVHAAFDLAGARA